MTHQSNANNGDVGSGAAAAADTTTANTITTLSPQSS